MLAYIKGILEMKMTGYVVIDVGGLGYKVYMTDTGIENVGNIGDTVKVHTYYKVREDDVSIFGFNSLLLCPKQNYGKETNKRESD